MTVEITLTVAGIDTGPFDLYSNLNLAVPFAIDISKSTLQSGYTSSAVPDFTTSIRVVSKGICINYADIVLPPYVPVTTTTTSSTLFPTTTTSTTPAPTTTTSTTTAIPEVPCNETVTSGGAGVTESYVTLLPEGGLLVFALNAYGVPDKLEILHNGVKKATTSMTSPNEGPFDDVYGSPTVPTQPETLPIPQFIGADKAPAVIPNRQATFNAETGSSLIIPGGFQQLVWWEYTPADYIVNAIAAIRITGTTGTVWDLQRLCNIPPSTTTTTTTLAPGMIPLAYNGTNTIRSVVTGDFNTARNTPDVTSNTNFSVACFRNIGNFVVQRTFAGFDTTAVTTATGGGIQINITSNTLATSTSFVFVRTNINHPANYAWGMGDFTDSLGAVVQTNIVTIPMGYTGTVNFPFNATGLAYINGSNDNTFVLVQYPNDHSDSAPAESVTQNISGANSSIQLYYS